jgi:serine/threonine-protein phosphatase PGAM5
MPYTILLSHVTIVLLVAFCVSADMLSYPGSTHLVITHKSLLRSMLCTAMGLPPRQFRAIDLSNGAVCMVR